MRSVRPGGAPSTGCHGITAGSKNSYSGLGIATPPLRAASITDWSELVAADQRRQVSVDVVHDGRGVGAAQLASARRIDQRPFEVWVEAELAADQRQGTAVDHTAFRVVPHTLAHHRQDGFGR